MPVVLNSMQSEHKTMNTNLLLTAMREEERTSIRLPGRMAHIVPVEDKVESEMSAPSALELNHSESIKDAREDSTEDQKGEDGSDSRFLDGVSGCRLASNSACSDTSTLTSEVLQGQEKSIQAIDLSLKFLSGIRKDSKSEASLMPGIRYTEFTDFEHTGLLVSNISKKIRNNDSKLLPEVTMRPGAKIEQMLRESRARKLANFYQEKHVSPVLTKGEDQHSHIPTTPRSQDETFQEKFGNGDTSAHGRHKVDSLEMEPLPSLFHLTMRTPQGFSFNADDSIPSEEGEEHTLDDYEGTFDCDEDEITLSSEEMVKIRSNANHFFLQPELDPCGILLAFDNIMGFKDHQDSDEDLDLSPQTTYTWTVDSLNDEAYDDAALENDSIDQFLPCWREEFNSPDFLSFDESTRLGDASRRVAFLSFDESTLVGDASQFDRIHSKASLAGSEEDDHSFIRKFLEGLELESTSSKSIPLDQTLTTEGDSTISYDLKLF